jgi:hypothetical protein
MENNKTKISPVFRVNTTLLNKYRYHNHHRDYPELNAVIPGLIRELLDPETSSG